MLTLTSLLTEINTLIPHHRVLNPAVSGTSIGWHIEHSLLTINRIVEALKMQGPDGFQRRFNISRVIVFGIGKIPRGRAKAPGIVRPNQFDESSLQQHLISTYENIKELEKIPPQHYFNHPYFGHLKVKPAKKFLIIHTQHHLFIMRDIHKGMK